MPHLVFWNAVSVFESRDTEYYTYYATSGYSFVISVEYENQSPFKKAM